MGKKEGKKRERELEEEEEVIDPELQAELNAIMAMRSEKQEKEALQGKDKDVDATNGSYNAEAILQFCESMGTEALPFEETLQIANFDLDVQDDHDDLEREMTFYNHALAAVHLGRAKLTEMGIKFRRPDDFFCESIKSDAHMARVKDKLILEEKKISAFEQRKNRDTNKKFNKQVATLRKEEKLKSTKDEIKDVKRLRKNKEGGDNEEIDKELEKVLERNSKKQKRGEGDRNRDEKSAKRQAFDKKYGHGGKEVRKSKFTDAKSLNDFSSFNPRGGSLNRRDKGGKHAESSPASFKRGRGGGKPKSKNRPGKSVRVASRKARSS